MIALIFLKPDFPTTLKFDAPIEFVSLGKENKFFKYLSSDRKILVIKPLRKSFDIPMVIITKNESFQFRLKNSIQQTSSFYQIKKGKKDFLFQLKKETKNWTLLVGQTTLKVRKKSEKTLNINFTNVEKAVSLLPKGTILLINQKRVNY